MAKRLSLPGYSYLPLSQTPSNPNTAEEVVPDFAYSFGMGAGKGTFDTFSDSLNLYLNDTFNGRLDWEMEFITLRASDIFTAPAAISPTNTITPGAPVLGVLIFEPYFRHTETLTAYTEIACEAYYFIPDVGPVKITSTMVATPPGDGANQLRETRQICFYQFRDEINRSQAYKNQPPVHFTTFNARKQDIDSNHYSTFLNTMLLTSYKVHRNPAAGPYGFDSPAASLMDIPAPNVQIYIANERFWMYKPDGLLFIEGRIKDHWQKENPAGCTPTVCSSNPATLTSLPVFPWSYGKPDDLEYGADVLAVTGQRGVIINHGYYWLHNPGNSFPQAGKVGELFPGYSTSHGKDGIPFGDDTSNLSISNTGAGQLLLVKDGHYMYYQKIHSRPHTAFPPAAVEQPLVVLKRSPRLFGHATTHWTLD